MTKASSPRKYAPRTKRTLAERLEEATMPVPEAGCWFWLGWTQSGGYGVLRVDEKQVMAHRASWEIHRGPIPEGIKVLHRCDTPCCINPDHLFLGTQADNVKDMIQKRRNVPSPGERNGNAKLTADEVRKIRASEETLNILSGRFGVSMSMISCIKRGENWR